MTFRKLHKSGRSQPESALPQPPPTQRFAPPSGPPPQWPQWQTPYQPSPGPSGSQHRSLGGDRNRNVPHNGAPLGSRPILSREDDLKRLFKSCKTGKGNAQLLHEAVIYAKPEDLEGNELIEEFRKKCQVTQEYLSSAIPWASAEAERSRLGNSQGQETKEEELLAELLNTNQELLDALHLYDDLQRAAADQKKSAEHKLLALDALTKYNPTPSESSLVDRIFEIGDPRGNGSISVHTALKILQGSELPPDILRRVWDIANVEENEMFERHCAGAAVRLIGYAQKGTAITEDLVAKAGPLAVIDGLDTPSSPSAYNMAGPSTTPNHMPPIFSPPSSPPSSLPTLTAHDRMKFMKIFMNANPENGVLNGSRAGEVLLKSRLPQETLGQIWDLADVGRRGALDAPAFTIAMYLVQACMSGQMSSVPPSLPPSLYAEAARASPSEAFDSQYLSGAPARSGASPMPSPPTQSLIDLDDASEPTQMPVPTILGRPLTPQRTPSFSPPRSPLSPGAIAIWQPASPFQHTPSISRHVSAPLSAQPIAIPPGWTWDVSPSDKTSSDKFFDTLDPWKHGHVEGEAAAPFLAKSKLSHEQLEKIWDLADLNHDGRLTREEFAVVMYLIRSKIAGREIPDTLPPSLVPPANLPSIPAQAATEVAAQAETTPMLTAVTTGRTSLDAPPPPYEEPDISNIPDEDHQTA